MERIPNKITVAENTVYLFHFSSPPNLGQYKDLKLVNFQTPQGCKSLLHENQTHRIHYDHTV